MKPELFIKAQNLWRRVGEAGARVVAAPTDAGRRRKIVLLTAALIAAVLVVIYIATHIGGEESHAPADADTRQPVTAVQIQPREFHQTIALTGAARPKRDIQVTAPATGVRILELLVDEGQQVRLGQPMARLDTALSNAQIRAAEAAVAEARSAAVRARGEYQRADSIRDSGALSTEAIEQRRAAAQAADAQLAAAQAQQQEVNARLGGGYVRAPAAGLVIDRTAEVGRSVDGQVLFRIAAGNALEVSAQVAEADILALRPGQNANFQLVDGSTVQARLSRLPASIDPQTRTGEALFDLPVGSRVRAGMYLRGAAQLAPRTALALPQAAVQFANGAPFVFVIGDDGRVRRTPVQVGARDGDWIELISGADAGARIAGSGAAFLQDGDQVRTLAAQAPVQPAQAPAQPAPLRGTSE